MSVPMDDTLNLFNADTALMEEPSQVVNKQANNPNFLALVARDQREALGLFEPRMRQAFVCFIGCVS